MDARGAAEQFLPYLHFVIFFSAHCRLSHRAQDLAKAIRDLQTKYKNAKLVSVQEAMGLAVVPLFKRLDETWRAVGMSQVMGEGAKRPVWWSPARRAELSRLLAVRLPFDCGTRCSVAHLL